MFPRVGIEIDISIPDGDTYWVPKPSDIGDEGFGAFRGVWPIVKATTRLTADVIEDERIAAEYADSHSSTPEAFEQLARDIESYLPSLDESEGPAFVAELGESWDGLEGLELGVAGLTYALSNAGFYPAASCRSHDGKHSWSPNPVVLFAGDRPRVVLLQALVQGAGCGLGTDTSRGDLLHVYAPSIVEMMALARNLYDQRMLFRKLPKTARKRSPQKPRTSLSVALF